MENDGTTIGRESEEGERVGIVFPGKGVVTVEGGAEGMKAMVNAVSKVEAGEKGNCVFLPSNLCIPLPLPSIVTIFLFLTVSIGYITVK